MLDVLSPRFAPPPIVLVSVALLLMIAAADGQNVTAAQPSQAGASGWLILRGELIPGPYVVEVAAESVTVNGISIKSSPQVSTEVRPTGGNGARFQARDQAFQNFWEAWNSWCEEDGLEAAERKALQFWRASPLVLQAYFPNPQRRSDLAVLFLGDQKAELIELRPASHSALPADEADSQSLRELALSLQYALTHGGLVIVQDEGYSYTTAPGEGEAMLRRLQEIARNVGDLAERGAAMHEIVPNDGIAEAMAEHLQP